MVSTRLQVKLFKHVKRSQSVANLSQYGRYQSTTKSATFPLATSKMIQIYQGPLSRTVRLMKLFSISSLGATCAMAPLVFYVDVSELISDAVKGVMMGTAIAFSSASTALIHWCLKSYVTRAYVLPAPQEYRESKQTEELTDEHVQVDKALDAVECSEHMPVAFETLNIWGRPKLAVAPFIKAVEPHQVIFGTWRVNQLLDMMNGAPLTRQAPRKLFVHAEAALNGHLGEPAQLLATLVHERASNS